MRNGAHLHVTRQGEAPTSAVGGLEVRAQLRDDGILCMAQLSDFGPGYLVVVQVDVALFGSFCRPLD
jgi:hypothetical protein